MTDKFAPKSTYELVLDNNFRGIENEVNAIVKSLSQKYKYVMDNLRTDLFVSKDAMQLLISEILKTGNPLLIDPKSVDVMMETKKKSKLNAGI